MSGRRFSSHCRLGVLAALLAGAVGASAQVTDYDDNDNGLIDIRTLAQLNAVRWDLDGDGVAVSSASTTYNATFPSAAAGMGCPDTAADSDTDPGPCTGYELRNDLDFDTDGDGDVDADDPNTFANWVPIGGTYSATFEGNGYTMSNLRMANRYGNTGLFSTLGNGGTISGVGLVAPRVSSNRVASQNLGTLVGQSNGTIVGSYALGGSVSASSGENGGRLGGLVGFASGGAIRASFSSASVSVTARTNPEAGGLTGQLVNATIAASYATGAVSATTWHRAGGRKVGGLVGRIGDDRAMVINTYATGAVSGSGSYSSSGGLVGLSSWSVVQNSYWNRNTTGQSGSARGGQSKTTSELQSPTGYIGIYADWDDYDTDDDGTAGVAVDADDDAWSFGTDAQYPVLSYYGMDTAIQFAAQSGTFGTSTVAQMTFRTGVAVDAFQIPEAIHSGALTYTAANLPAGLSFDGDGTGACGSARTVCGTPTFAGTYTVVVQATSPAGGQGSLSFAVTVGGIAIDADPATAAADAGPLALSEDSADAAHSRSYTVKLASAPTGPVTVTVASGNAAAVVVDTAGNQDTLTFGPTSWNTAQPVTLMAAQDDGDADESVAITHAASGGGYDGVSAPLTATVDDDDALALAVDADPSTPGVDAGPLILDEATARSGSYAVRLAAEPTATTTVRVSSDNAAVAVDTDLAPGRQAALTFTALNWNIWQTVAAMTTSDADAVDEASDVAHVASAAGHEDVSRILRVAVRDDEQTGTDYDGDEDGLIEIASLAQLNAVRWDLDGNGFGFSATTSAAYRAAFPGAAAGMGCPDGGDSDDAPDACAGYELTRDLDFDTDADGSTWAEISGTATSDAADAYHNGGSGWWPIGTQGAPFNTTFDGNGKVVWNLFVKRGGNDRGLFGRTGTAARITSVGLANARVQGFETGGGALAGFNVGRIAASWSSGFVLGFTASGGLVGMADTGGQVVASYSTAAVVCTGGGTSAGGLVGYQANGAGIASSYSIGTVTGGCGNKYGLVHSDDTATVASSYWDVDLSSIGDDGDANPPEGRSTAQLQMPTAYGTTSLYSAWDDVDVDGDGVAGAALDADDNVWDFGTPSQHPALKAANFDTALQFNSQGADLAPTFDTSTVAARTYQNGQAITAFTVPAASGGNGALSYMATGLPAGLSFGAGACGAARVACGTPIADGSSTATITVEDGDDNTRASDRATLAFAIAVVTPSAAVAATSPATLAESNLDGATLTVALASTTFAGGVTASSFALTTDVPGLTIGSVAATPSGAVSTTLTLAYTGANFDDARALTVTVADAAHALVGDLTTGAVTVLPTRDVTLSTSTLSVQENGSATYTVRLDSQPLGGTVTVAIGGAGSGIAASPTALTFTWMNWNAAQSVTVGAAEDGNGMNESATLTHTPFGANYGGVAPAELRVTALDNDRPGLRVEPQMLRIAEGSSATYALRLNTDPGGAVTVTVGGATAAVTADADGDRSNGSQHALTFTGTTWNTAQSVTASAAEDDNATDESVTLTHAVEGAGDYASLNAEARPGVQVTVDDADTQGLLIDADPSTPALNGGPLALNEQPGPDNAKQYTVRLETRPTAAVEVSIESGDRTVSVDGDATPRTRTLTFSTSTWDTAQTVTATAAQDDDASDEAVAIAHQASGGDYGDVSATLTATTVDDDAPALVLATTTLASGVAEGSTATYTVRLATEPTGPVTVSATATGDATGAVEVDVDGGQAGVQSSLRFDASNWAVARTATLRGLEDDDGADGAATLRHAASGSDYRGVAAPAETFDVRDDDARAVLVGASTVHVNEGSTAQYAVRLGTRPVGGPVTVSLSSSDAAAALASPASMTFTGSNWSSPQLATVRGVVDSDTANATTTIAHAASGADYNGLSPASVSIQVRDAQAAGVRIEPPALSLREGESGVYRVRLNTPPASDATVEATTAMSELGVDADATPRTRTLTFTTQNWAVEQAVTVRVGSDAGADDETLTVEHTVSNYVGVATAPSLEVRVQDSDAAGMVFDPVAGVSVSEAGSSAATYTVALSAQPTGLVTVRLSSDDAGLGLDASALPGDQSSLVFDATNWNVPKTVTVRAAADEDAASETAALLHTASGGGYDGVSARYAVRVLDADAAPAPADVLATAAGPTSLAVRWTPSARADAHLLQWRLAGRAGGEWSAARQLTLAGHAGSARIDGLSPSTAYEVRVLGVNRGDPGAPSEVARATTQAGGSSGGGGGGGGGDGLPEPESATLSASVTSAPEGGMARLTVRLSSARAAATRIVWSIGADADAATADADAADVATTSGAATIAAGQTRAEIAIAIADDAAIEPAREWFEASLAAPDGCCGAAVRARVAVLEGVCDRTPAVRDALRGSAACTVPTPASLAAMERLAVPGAGSLRAGDFAGLAGLRALDLSGNGLGSLPTGLFAGLGALRSLDLSANALELPARPFADLRGLRALLLADNGFETLPAGLFAGLDGLRELSLEDNPGAPFALAVELARTDAAAWAPGPATVRARFAPSAPFALRAALSAEPAAAGLPAAVAIDAGSVSGRRFAVAASASALRLTAGPAALPATRCGDMPCLRGIEAVQGETLVLYRRPPRARPAPELEPLEGGDDLRLALGSLIDRGGGDPAALRWRASSSDESVATARVVGGDLVVTPAPGGEGAVAIVLEVVDEAGQAATLRFEVRMAFHRPPSVVGGWRAGALIEAAQAGSKPAR